MAAELREMAGKLSLTRSWFDEVTDKRLHLEAQVRNYNVATAIGAVHGPA